MTIPDAPLAARRLAGYRVLRSLARDERAEVFLGFAEREIDASAPNDPPDRDETEPTTVALATMSATPQRWGEMLDVLEALERAHGPHVVEVLDVDADEEVLCVVFERLPNGSLADLLASRERLEAGEVVTIVAPLADAIQRMHEAGVAHGALRSRTVMFRADGAPVLIGFGRASLFASGAAEVVREREPGVCADRRAIRELACMLLSRVAGSRARAARALITELEQCPEELVLELIGRRLFEVAAALPVRFEADGPDESHGDGDRTSSSNVSVRMIPLGSPGDGVGDGDGEGETKVTSTGALGRLLARALPDSWVRHLGDVIDGGPLASLLATAQRVWGTWSNVRRRMAVGAIVAAMVVGGALAIVPSAPSSPAERVAVPMPSPRISTSDRAGSALGGDDPLAAAVVLVSARDSCLRSLSVRCLDEVDQADAGAIRDDREAIRLTQQGGGLPVPLVPEGLELSPELVERLGDSALVRLAFAEPVGTATVPSAPSAQHREPASVLLVKGEAGWRLRDVIPAPARSSANESAASR
jgi:hypothetical protein